MLHELVQRDLLRGEGAFLRVVTEASVPAANAVSIDSVGWVTRDRPELLKRSVESFVDNCRRHNRTAEYKIFDDSPAAETRGRIRQDLIEVAKNRRVRILYAGLDEKRGLANQILNKAVSAQLPEEVLEFALFDPFDVGHTVGANCNCFLLATAGEASILLDDDVVSRFCSTAGPSQELALTASPDPTHFRFFYDRKELLDTVDFHDLPVLESHEKLLGKSLSECLRSAMRDGIIDVSKLTPDFVQLLEAHPPTVAITMTGVCGDSGMGSSRMFLGLTEENREALLATEEQYRSALVSREMLRVARRPTVGQGGVLMAMNCGFDNRALLLPFFPVLRGSDGLLSQTLRATQPESLIGYLPIACFHDPRQRRAHSREDAWSSSIRTVDLLILLVRSFGTVGDSGKRAQSLRALGEFLVHLGESGTSRFMETVAGLWVAEMSRYIEYLEYLLAAYDFQPDYWAEDVSAHIESIKRRITSTRIVPDDLGVRGGPGKTEELCQELVAAFGKLLYWWPLIWETARSLKSEGVMMLSEM
jgi:hypothetical protein